MTTDEFWALIDRVDCEALEDGDEDAALVPLLAAVAARPEEEIAAFAEHVARALFELDSRVHEENSGQSRGSPDCFLYARCFVVASGRAHYEAVLADPTAMPRTLDEWCEALIYVAQNAWAARTGGEPAAWGFHASVSYESYSNKAKW